MKQKVTRFALTLLLSVLTAATAWANDPAWLKSGDSWDETTKTLTVNTATVVDFAYMNHSEIENVIISNGVTSIGSAAFAVCTNLKTVFVGNGVTSIGSSAFENCTSLTSINIPASVTSIGAGAFAGCTNLKTVFVGNGVTSIGNRAFDSCTNLKAVFMTRTSSAPSLSGNPFVNTPNLKIYVPVDYYGNILSVYQSNGWSSYSSKLCASWSSGTCAAGLNDGVLTVVGFGAFENCIGFNSRSNITSIVIEEGVTSIGDQAFYGCGGLTAISIPNSVTSIGGGAFASCHALESVTIYATSVPTLGSDVFWDNKSGRKIFVPTASLSTYKSAPNWSNYATDIVPLDWEGAYAGTEDDPYMIYSTDHLLKLAYRVKGTHGETANDYENKYFKLGADIAFTYDPNETDDYDENYEAIGGYYNSDIRIFNGNFNGDGHTVSGIRLRKTGTDIANDYQGLFGEIGSNAIIHDVHVTDARIKGRLCVGGIVGYSYEGTVRNCTVTESDITATNGHYGTICGFNSQGIFSHNYYRHCTVNGTANATNVGCMGADITDTQGAIPAFLVTLGDDATIETAMAADLGFSYGGKNYWRTGAELTLGHANRDGYAFIGYTVTDTGSNPVSVTENNDVYTFTMPASDVTVTANLIEKIPYIDETGKTVDCTNYTVLNNTMTTISAGWYVVKSNVTFSDNLSTNVSSGVDNTVNIILCDGATLTANNITPNTNYDRLCIYGQSQGTGTANISGNIMGNYSISIYGGTINATGNIICPQGGIGIYGGTVTAGSLVAPNTGSQIRLGGATVTAGSYNANDGVTILPGITYYDGTGVFYTAGNLDADQITAITGKTLVPVTLSGTCGVDDPATGDVDESQNVTWLYDISTHTLTISGTGDMAEYASANDVPWATYKVNITTAAISAGVTTINSCAFNQGTIINLSYTGSVPDGYTFGGYTVTDAGSNPVSVTGNNGVYTFTMPDEDVTITVTLKKLMTNNDITVTIPSQTWTGNELTPVITVKDGQTVLTLDEDYTVTAPSGPIQDSGNYTYTITGMGNYSDSKEATFTISPFLTYQFGAVYVYRDQNGMTALLEGTSVDPVDIDYNHNIIVNHVTSNRVFTPGMASTVMLPFNYTCNGGEGGTFYKFVGVKKENDKWVATMQETGNDTNKQGTLEANTPYLFMPAATTMTFPNINGSVRLFTRDGGSGGNCETADPGSHWTFKGTYRYIEWTADTTDPNFTQYAEEIGRAYGFAGVAKDGINVGDFVRVASGAKIRPMRAYLLWNDIPNAANARSFTRGAAATDEELPQRITVRLVGSNGEVTGIGEIDTKTGEMTFDSEAWYTLDGVIRETHNDSCRTATSCMSASDKW